MGLSNQIQTIGDLERAFYGQYTNGKFVNETDAQSGQFPVAKATLVSTAGIGYWQAIYGAQAWIQLNMEANAFGVLPKVPWGNSGLRLISARGESPPTAGVAQDGSIPSTIYPTVDVCAPKVKTAMKVWEISEIQEALATAGRDDAYLNMEQSRKYMIIAHKEDINKMLLGEFGTLSADAFESIDRVTASSVERIACGETENDENLYSVNRSANTWFNGTVSHNSNSDRYLTENILQTHFRTIGAAGANTSFILTGWDTWGAWNELYEPQRRFDLLGASMIKPGVNGVEVVKEGVAAGTRVATWNGCPIIISKDVTIDTLSRIYMLDTSNPEGNDLPRLCIKILKPTEYLEAGVNAGTPLELGKMNLKGAYRTSGELTCPFPAVQGKIRDLM